MSGIDRQIDLIAKIQSQGVNLVTCGDCGTTQLVDINENQHVCYDCEYISDPCDFPDYFYEGMPEQSNSHDLDSADKNQLDLFKGMDDAVEDFWKDLSTIVGKKL